MTESQARGYSFDSTHQELSTFLFYMYILVASLIFIYDIQFSQNNKENAEIRAEMLVFPLLYIRKEMKRLNGF